MYVGLANLSRRKDGRRKIYVGMDLHKDALQIAIVDGTGRVESNSKISNTFGSIDRFFGDIPKSAGIVMEASSISEGIFLHLRESGFSPVLSNPYKTKAIAYAKIKTDRIDAEVLAQMLRGGFIPHCHMPSQDMLDMRHMIRHRRHLAANHRILRRRIHAVLLAGGARIAGTPFSRRYVQTLREMKNYRIDDCLHVMDAIDSCIRRIDRTIRESIEQWPDDAPRLLLTIPGIGPYTAMLIVSEIDDISRFPDSDSLCSYAGLVPSTHSSGGKVRHGGITRHGSAMLRSVLSECVLSHKRVRKDSNISRFHARLARKKGNPKATVAAAAKLLRVCYWLLKERREYAESMEGHDPESPVRLTVKNGRG